MPRIAIVNMLIGFILIFVSSLSGFFVAYNLGEGFKHDPASLNSWQMIVMAASHGHTSLYGMLHVFLGLTIPYSVLSSRVKVAQTFGVLVGAFSMSVLMMLRMGRLPQATTEDYLGFLIASGLMLSLGALFLHCIGLAFKLSR